MHSTKEILVNYKETRINRYLTASWCCIIPIASPEALDKNLFYHSFHNTRNVGRNKFIRRIYHTEQEEILISEFIEPSSRHGVKLTAHLTVIGVYLLRLS